MATETKTMLDLGEGLLGFSAGESPAKSVAAKVGEKKPQKLEPKPKD